MGLMLKIPHGETRDFMEWFVGNMNYDVTSPKALVFVARWNGKPSTDADSDVFEIDGSPHLLMYAKLKWG